MYWMEVEMYSEKLHCTILKMTFIFVLGDL